ncbi:uncharacterized protein EDB91DRAFT_1082648 [Suillus paluster]|uniref:uncharacterized protein n=1 Tax=Suillus paluster TaxID=48578 RepID=UPI001B87967C|nr:uncharacterized protein EDB91DRAFT_1082648 [Suillus paluster]KAG1738604.1 hypothetical protein EDB91DRAFT_1082648 [Suillus paluster]
MSDNSELAPGSYKIESAQWSGQLVTLGGGDAIEGYEKLVGGVQVWQLRYTEHGYATFQGSSADVPDGNFIAVDWNSYTLVYSDKPSNFMLRREGDYFVVKVNVPDAVFSWQLPSPENGSRMRTDHAWQHQLERNGIFSSDALNNEVPNLLRETLIA